MNTAAHIDQPDLSQSSIPSCAACARSFPWREARLDPGDVGGLGGRPPRLRCPGCDMVVAQWHLDLVSDHVSWVWAFTQDDPDAVLPSDPPERWGMLPAQRTSGALAGW